MRREEVEIKKTFRHPKILGNAKSNLMGSLLVLVKTQRRPEQVNKLMNYFTFLLPGTLLLHYK